MTAAAVDERTWSTTELTRMIGMAGDGGGGLSTRLLPFSPHRRGSGASNRLRWSRRQVTEALVFNLLVYPHGEVDGGGRTRTSPSERQDLAREIAAEVLDRGCRGFCVVDPVSMAHAWAWSEEEVPLARATLRDLFGCSIVTAMDVSTALAPVLP